MTKIWYDTEFVENGTTIELVSIGLIREDSLAYYGVNSNAVTMGRVVRHPWLAANVLPHLPVLFREGGKIAGSIDSWDWDKNHPDWHAVRHISEIAAEVRDFILAAGDPQLNAWYAAYDHVRLMQLWGPMSARPEGIPMWTRDLKQEADRLGVKDVPAQHPGTEHHALMDAQHDREIDEFLEEYQRKQLELWAR
jgi:hypothetical protein